MKAWQLAGGFGLEYLQQSEQSCRALGKDEVRVRIRACSLNYRDLLVINGHYNPHQALPLIPVSDGAGEVVEIGSDVRFVKIGQRVCATFSQNWDHGRVDDKAQRFTLGSPLPGMLAEEGVFKEQGLIAFPSFLSFVEASTLPCAAVTAFNALTHEADLKPGQSVLLEGTGGVSIFALQFAKALQLKTIAMSSSALKLERLRELGADHVIDYKAVSDWPHMVKEFTDGQGVDAVLDVGGKDSLNKAIASLKRGGAVCLIGILGGTEASIDIVAVLMRQLRLLGVFVGSKSVFLAMNRVIEHKKIKPVVNRVFTFDEAPAALAYLASGNHFGKVCIEMKESH